MTVRMDPEARRELIVDAALAVMLRKGLGATRVRDVAREMGSSPGLVHHYFGSMDELLATAFERAAGQGFDETRTAISQVDDPVAKLRVFFATYSRAEQDWAFQLWLDAWAEAGRRPAVRQTTQRLNVAWQQLLVQVIDSGVREGAMTCADPEGAAWRMLSMLDGLALQTVAHPGTVDRKAVVSWSVALAEQELGLPTGTLVR
jgi:AcrR family transcriptional regulator